MIIWWALYSERTIKNAIRRKKKRSIHGNEDMVVDINKLLA